MAHPNLATQTLEAGARSVHFIGCPPEDCANREGNLWMQARISRERLPRLNQTFKSAPIFSDWLPPNNFAQALETPNQHKEATSYQRNWNQINWINFIPAILLLILVFLVQIWLSDRSFQPYSSGNTLLEIVLDHKAGYPINGVATNLEPNPGLDFPTRLILEVAGQTRWEETYFPQGKKGRAIAFEQTPLAPGENPIKIIMFDRPNQEIGQILFEGTLDFENYDTLRLEFADAPIGSDPIAGRELFFESSLGASASCHVCHSLDPNELIVGPALGGIAIRAAERVPGMSAEAYLRESIVDPDAYIVEGFPAGLMLPDLEENLTQTQIDNLVAFLLTLK
jgi:hypothetical protein